MCKKKSCSGGKGDGGEEVQFRRSVERRLGRIFVSGVVWSCVLLLRKMLSGQNRRDGAALNNRQMWCGTKLHLERQPASQPAELQERITSRHQPLVFIIFISLTTPIWFFLGEFMYLVDRKRKKAKQFLVSPSEFPHYVFYLNICFHSSTIMSLLSNLKQLYFASVLRSSGIVCIAFLNTAMLWRHKGPFRYPSRYLFCVLRLTRGCL